MKKRRIIKHERALHDLEPRSEYIRRRNPRAALRFLNAAEATFRLLAAQPGLGARYEPDHPILSELRFFPITGFKNDLVFYQPSANGIQVLRVLHGAQEIHRVLAEDYGIADDGDVDIETE
jgi:toxin ParE1/3/4